MPTFFEPDLVETDEAAPPADRILAGTPHGMTATVFASPDGRFSAGRWTSTPGRWRVRYDEHEYCRIIAGRGTVTRDGGAARPIGAGDEFVVPAGFQGEWEVIEPMTKTWVVMLP